MKSLLRLLGGLSVSLLLLASCVRSEVDDSMVESNDSNTIAFFSSINQAATKAAGNYFESNDEISVSAYYNDVLYVKDVKYIYSDATFSSDDPIMISYDYPSLSYWAVYPYTTVEDYLVGFSIIQDQSVDGAYTMSDLMSSYVSTTPVSTPTLTFNHLLSNVVVNLSTSEDINLAGVNVALSSVPNIEYNIQTGEYTTSGNSTMIVAANNGTNSYKAVLMPQTIAAGEIFATVTFSSGEVVNLYAQSDIKFKSGCQYSYNLVATTNATTGVIEISFEGEQSEEWGEENNEDEESSWAIMTGANGETKGVWTDGLMGGLFGVYTAVKEVDVYYNKEIPGLYRIENIYTADFSCQIWGCSEEEEDGFAIDPSTQETPIYTYIHAEDPDNVWIAYQNSGYYVGSGYGYFYFGSLVPENDEVSGYSGYSSNYGTEEDGYILFPSKTTLIALDEYGGAWYGGADVSLLLPGGTDPNATTDSYEANYSYQSDLFIDIRSQIDGATATSFLDLSELTVYQSCEVESGNLLSMIDVVTYHKALTYMQLRSPSSMTSTLKNFQCADSGNAATTFEGLDEFYLKYTYFWVLDVDGDTYPAHKTFLEAFNDGDNDGKVAFSAEYFDSIGSAFEPTDLTTGTYYGPSIYEAGTYTTYQGYGNADVANYPYLIVYSATDDKYGLIKLKSSSNDGASYMLSLTFDLWY